MPTELGPKKQTTTPAPTTASQTAAALMGELSSYQCQQFGILLTSFTSVHANYPLTGSEVSWLAGAMLSLVHNPLQTPLFIPLREVLGESITPGAAVESDVDMAAPLPVVPPPPPPGPVTSLVKTEGPDISTMD